MSVEMQKFEAVSTLVHQTHRNIWDEWYAGFSYVRARLQIELSDQSSGYSHSNNQIILAVPAWNLDDPDILDSDDWPIWKTELIHEMLHEWQMKTPCVVTAEAESLCRQYAPQDCGRGHDADFFQAVIEKAPYFGMTPEELLARI
jgi:hypothetical protein